MGAGRAAALADGAVTLVATIHHVDALAVGGVTRRRRALPQSRLAVVEGAGHLVDMEQPEALAKLIVQFVAES